MRLDYTQRGVERRPGAHMLWDHAPVREVPTSILKNLDLKTAAERESVHWRNLLPEEPWRESLSKNPGNYDKWAETRLKAGHRNAPGWPVDARKAHQAFRPVPVVGIAERIVYRALTDWILKDVELPERSQDEYRRFVAGPDCRRPVSRRKRPAAP